MQTIGTGSLCGGPVQVPQMLGGSVLPVPTCARCGSIVARAYGPVIQMRSPQSVEFLGSGAFHDNVHVDLIRK